MIFFDYRFWESGGISLLYIILAYRGQKQKLAFIQSAMPMTGWTNKIRIFILNDDAKEYCYQSYLTLPLLIQKRDSPNKEEFFCADCEGNADTYLPLKYEDRVGR